MKKDNLDFYSIYVDSFNELPQRGKELIFKNLDFITNDIIQDIFLYTDELKSPIEKILAISLIINFTINKINIFFDYQKEIQIDEKKYVADFIIEYSEVFNSFLKNDFKLVIERDGYEFHNKTREQIDYDNHRDYDMKINGYEVLRFSGSEIYNNPDKCFYKIIKFIYERGINNE